MEKGKLLGKGRTAEVYEWGQDKVLKLYYDKFTEEFVRNEASVGQRIYEAGIPSPAVFDIVEFDGRKGIILERISGKTIVDTLATKPWMFGNFVRQMAEFHHEIHKHTAADIPSQKERFNRTINLSSEVLGDKVKKILDYIDTLPEGNSICHGDMYLSNIMISNNKFVAIDWSSGYRGDPSSDIARTCMIINSPALLPGTPKILASMAAYPKKMTYWSYLNEYMRVSDVKFEDIDAWILPVAAAKLKDRIPGEEKWLMKIIDMRLEQLEAKRSE